MGRDRPTYIRRGVLILNACAGMATVGWCRIPARLIGDGMAPRVVAAGASRRRYPAVLLQHRAPWSHQGGTWALPGGARDSHETPEQAAVREAHEEAGLRAEHVAVRATVVTAEVVGTGGAQWSYTTVVADAPELLSTVANRESSELRWVAEDEVIELPLHPGFAASWERLRITTMLSAHEHEECLLAVPHTVEIRAGVFAWCTSAAAEVS